MYLNIPILFRNDPRSISMLSLSIAITLVGFDNLYKLYSRVWYAYCTFIWWHIHDRFMSKVWSWQGWGFKSLLHSILDLIVWDLFIYLLLFFFNGGEHFTHTHMTNNYAPIIIINFMHLLVAQILSDCLEITSPVVYYCR